jgi:hypothetical protein
MGSKIRKSEITEIPIILSKSDKIANLPKVAGKIFSNKIMDKMKMKNCLVQCFMILFKIIKYGDSRLLVYRLNIHIEISDTVFLCQDIPRILLYYGWVIDHIYGEFLGYGSILDLYAEEVSMYIHVYVFICVYMYIHMRTCIYI